MGPVLPPGDDPLVEQVLQLGQAPERLVGDPVAAAGDVAAGVAGDVLAEQAGDRGELPLDQRLVGRGALAGRLDRDAQPVARPRPSR
ncbi:hypothetical protein [Micromonospora sp. AMSO12t]|uniref:hypothetical protein n=1 Tax=Micromonospora sp. AMSO12t TaxID=2650410 RepID=UPI001CEDCF44|nr:hypothetical protein [Micromonospora sp. AMSO12t]